MSRPASSRILLDEPKVQLAGIGRRSPERSGGGSIELLGVLMYYRVVALWSQMVSLNDKLRRRAEKDEGRDITCE
jgi:hypothetical protein